MKTFLASLLIFCSLACESTASAERYRYRHVERGRQRRIYTPQARVTYIVPYATYYQVTYVPVYSVVPVVVNVPLYGVQFVPVVGDQIIVEQDASGNFYLRRY